MNSGFCGRFWVVREDHRADRTIRNLWETESYIDDNTLTVNVTRLRRRLEEIGLKDYILTKEGVGYYVEE